MRRTAGLCSAAGALVSCPALSPPAIAHEAIDLEAAARSGLERLAMPAGAAGAQARDGAR